MTSESDQPLHNDGAAQGSGTLFDLAYEDLRQRAAALMRRERAGHTLEATALIHEAYVRLAEQTLPEHGGREHLLAIVARAMRLVLIDHARRARSAKRGGGWMRITLSDVAGRDGRDAIDVLDLEAALERLEGLDPNLAQITELRYFAGMTIEEAGRYLGTDESVVRRDWNLARAWLTRELGAGPDR